ncbi:uncharacterized protein LOC132750588 isoform X2 [Ruditapes philippinarum]|uniref:uncharacterized protein LOC132750588 isoform X2 n=1 Tax=Ruditapes philippinarum TaxID=129788 RepID=UPI00295BCCDD|nr:uncharacterized protein LOC132750588 isoform X2 [Ruditapes philippinarum]
MDQGSFGSNQQSAYTAVPMVMQSSFVQQPVYHSYMPGAQQIQNVYSPNHTLRSDVYQHHAQLQSVAPQTASPQGLMFLSNIPPPFTQVPPRGQAIYYPPTPPQQYMSAAQQPDTAYLPASLPPLIPHHPHENLSIPPSSVAAQWSVAASPPSPFRLPVTPRSSPLPISFTPTVIPSRLKLLAEHYAVSKNEKSNTSSDMSMKSSSQHGIKVRNSVTATTADSTKSVISPSSGPNFPKLLSADRGIDIKNSEDENSKTDIQNLVDYYVNKHVGLSHPKVVDNGQVKQMDKSETEASSKDNLNNNNNAAESDTSDLKKGLKFPYKLEENSNVSSNVMKKNSDVLNWLSKSESEPGEGYPDTLVEELSNESVLKEVNGDVTLATGEQERHHCPKLDVRKNSVDSLKSEVALVNEYVATNDNYAAKKINNFFEAGSDVVIEEHELLLQNMTDDFSEYSQDNILIEDNGGIRSDIVHEAKENILHVKKGKDDSDDFEKFFFKVTASRHGISISSPEKEPDVGNGEVPNSSQSLKTVNDISSVEGSQSDVGDAFKLKASQSGIIVQDPRERAEFSTDSDAELDQSYRDRANLQRKRHMSTPVPSNIKLDPKIPEFKPRSRKRAVSCGLRAEAISEVDHKKEIDSTIRADAPAFVPIWKTTDPKKNNDIIPSEQKEQKQESTAQIDNTPLSKESASNTTVAIQAQPDTSDVNVETVKIVTKESSTVTCTCECRDVSVNTVTDAEIDGENEVVKRSSRRFSSKATNTDMSNKRTIGTQHSTKEKVKPQMNDQDTMTELLPELGEGCGGPCLDVLGAAQILQKQAVLMKSIGQIQNEMKESEVTEGKFQIKDNVLKFVLDVIGLFTERVEPCKLKNEIERKLQVFVDESLIHAKGG